MKLKKRILAIESSCDETSVCEWDGHSFNEATLSSLKKFANLGGIIPEVASRDHEQAFAYCLEKMRVKKYDYIAYTSEPGLPGSLIVGKVVAQTLAFLHDAPLLAINHIHSHIFSSFVNQKPQLPALALIVSGGHTAIYLLSENFEIKLLLQTPDDAVGEVLDKVGRVLGYEYPGGPKIDSAYDEKLADIKFIGRKPFSFSGLKTAVVQYVQRQGILTQHDVVAIGSSTNRTIVDILLHHLRKAILMHRPRSILLGGGVAANSLLRSELRRIGVPVHLPEMRYCGDNATMVAAAAIAELSKTDGKVAIIAKSFQGNELVNSEE